MPCIKCSNGKWKYGEKGRCQFDTLEACKKAEAAINAENEDKHMTTSTKKLGIQYRNFDLERAEINEEERTVPLAFSSEEPYERWWGTEILSHEPESVDLGRLNDGGALLVDHDMRDHVGVIESARVDKDKVGRAVVRFGRSARADEIFQDVLDGIRRHVSVGYRIHELVENRDDDTFTATRWQPHEVSLVSVPADPTVGVMRGGSKPDDFETTIITEEKIMPEENQDTRSVDTAAPAAPSIDTAKVKREAADQARKDELQRINEITALGREHNKEVLAADAIKDGKSVESVRIMILDEIRDSEPAPRPASEIGLTQKEAKRFSMLRALHALANPNNRQAQEAAAFEFECSTAVAQARGIDPQGLFVPEWNRTGFVDANGKGRYERGVSVPYEVQMARDLSAGTATDGAELVATNLLAGSFIDVLRNLSAVAGMGATFLNDLVGDVAIPRKTSGSAAGWIATEGGDASQSDPQFDQVTLTPKTAGVYSQVTRQLLLQSSLDVEMLLREDLAAGMATLIDLAALYGTGATGQPTGIANQTGIGAPTTWAAADPTFAEVVEMETVVATANALMGSLGYMFDAAMRGALKTTSKAGTEAQFIMDTNTSLVNGFNSATTEQVTDGDMFFGNWRDLLIGTWGNLDILIDPYTNSLSGTVRIVAHQSIDLAVRHPESFALGNDTP